MNDKQTKLQISTDISNSEDDAVSKIFLCLSFSIWQTLINAILHQDETSSVASTTTTSTSRSVTPTIPRLKKSRRGKKKCQQNKVLKPIYKFT